MNSRAVKATFAMVPVLAAAGGLLWLMYAPSGYRYEFEVASAATLDSVRQPEQHWRGVGAEKAGGGLFFEANESALATVHAGVMPLLADTARRVREASVFRPHQRIEVVAENVDVNGYSTQQRLITSYDTLFVVAKRDHDADRDADHDADHEAAAEGDADAAADVAVEVGKGAAHATVRVDTVVVSRAERGVAAVARARSAAARARVAGRDRAPSRERRFVRATHTETYVWTTEDLDPFVGRSFERFADSLVMLASHRTPGAIREKHEGQENGPYRGVALRIVSTAVTVDSLGRRREVMTRAEIRDLRKDRNGVAYVHRRKLENLDRRLSASPAIAPAAPPAPPAAPAPPAPVAAKP